MINQIKESIKGALNQNQKAKDMFASSWLQQYYPSQYFAYTDSTLRTHSLMNFINDVIINDRKNILEFGSGLSTIILSNIAKENNLDIKIYSIDDNLDWISYLKKYLTKDQLNKHIEFIHAPLGECPFSLDNNKWYDYSILKNELKNKKFDSVLIDGPMAYHDKIKLARYPAVQFVQEKLSKQFSVFLDDTDRVGERKVVKLWEEKFGLKFISINDSFSYCSNNEGYNFRIN